MSTYQEIGKSRPRVEGREKITGQGGYVADLALPGWTYARLVLSPHPRARVKEVLTAEAQRVPGVLAVLTDRDLGGHGLLAMEEIHYAGEPVAVVVAESEAAAEDGADLVRVNYERLPAVLNPISAMDPSSPLARGDMQLHGGEDAGAHGADTGGASSEAKPRNVTSIRRFQRGSLSSGFAISDVVTEGIYELAAVHQGYLETHGSAAKLEPDGSVTVWTSTQSQFSVRQAVAESLGVAEHQVKVIATTVGGAFGGKWVLLEPLAATLAVSLRRPVRIILDRIQDFLLSNPSPYSRIKIRMGAKRDGTLSALEAELLFDSGCQPEAPHGIAGYLMAGTYRIPHFDVRGLEVLTNKAPIGAYRAPGAPQAYFALESEMDKLARSLAMDPLEFRLRNASREGDLQADGKSWPRIGLVECLSALRDHPAWREKKKGPDEGIGVAVGGWPGGTEPAASTCRVEGDGTLTVHVGSVDITGVHTSMALVAAETFGVPFEKVRVVAANTEVAPYAGGSGGSKTTYTVGAAVSLAAGDARRQILELASERLEASVEDLELKDGHVSVRGVPSRKVPIGDLARLGMQFGSAYAPVLGQGRIAIKHSSPGFAAHLARVHVDKKTGKVKVVGYVAVQDVGRALNPAEVVGQIRGGVAQGIGRALLEAFRHDGSGQLMDANFMDYAMPSSTDLPDVDVVLVEVPSALGPFGARGVGEPPAIPGAAAVTNAVFDATGYRPTAVPILPEAVVQGLFGEASA